MMCYTLVLLLHGVHDVCRFAFTDEWRAEKQQLWVRIFSTITLLYVLMQGPLCAYINLICRHSAEEGGRLLALRLAYALAAPMLAHVPLRWIMMIYIRSDTVTRLY